MRGPASQTTSSSTEHKREDGHAPWDKCWIFSLAGVVLMSLFALGTWGRIRMLKDDNRALQQQIDTEEQIHEQVEGQLRKKLHRKTQLLNHLTREMSVAVNQFQVLNRSMKETQKHVKTVMSEVGDEDGRLAECNGVTLPHGFAYAPEGKTIFPQDVFGNTTSLHQVLESVEALQQLRDLTACGEHLRLFTQPTYPWLQWTWLRALADRPDLAGNFTEWGLARGGSSLFVAGLAKLHQGSFAGFDYWEESSSPKAVHPETVLQSFAQKCGLSVPEEAQYFNLAEPDLNLRWPGNGKQERIAFSHIDSDDYNTTLGILEVVYGNLVHGGMLSIDNFFHPSGGSKKAVEDFFRMAEPDKSPLIFPVFPGFSVLIFKDRFGNATNGDVQNALDGNFYSFEYIKDQPEIVDAVQQSLLVLSEFHRNAKNDTSVNQTQRCWLAHAVQTARTLRNFVESPSDDASDFEVQEMFRFMIGSAPVTRKVA
jgi:hypothetical protein|mmetsp:Transcript_39626/g.62943  ORF Transcript_39626/g.62943 Transcript_39626/m.62943 type:complete len:481 (+) Transcript_39626:46-1488(+)